MGREGKYDAEAKIYQEINGASAWAKFISVVKE